MLRERALARYVSDSGSRQSNIRLSAPSRDGGSDVGDRTPCLNQRSANGRNSADKRATVYRKEDVNLCQHGSIPHDEFLRWLGAAHVWTAAEL